MTDDASNRGGKVGYKRPPIHTRFRKGQSGNPRGRRKGVRNFAADVKRSLEIPVTLNDQGRAKRVSTQEALFMRLREKALKGDNRALETLLSLAQNPQQRRSGRAPGRPANRRPGPGDPRRLRRGPSLAPGRSRRIDVRPLAK